MALYKYTAIVREEQRESGTVLAQNEEEARKKLKGLQFQEVHVKKVGGLRGLVGRWVADIK